MEAIFGASILLTVGIICFSLLLTVGVVGFTIWIIQRSFSNTGGSVMTPGGMVSNKVSGTAEILSVEPRGDKHEVRLRVQVVGWDPYEGGTITDRSLDQLVVGSRVGVKIDPANRGSITLA